MLTTPARLFAATAIAGAMLVPASAAWGQTYGGGSAGPDNSRVVSSEPSKPLTSAPTSDAGGSLPFTGGDVASLTVIAAAAVGGGVLLSRTGRRRATA